MSSVVTSQYFNNILSCGYIREYEIYESKCNNNKLLIPSGVQTMIAMYCRQDIIYSIGCNDYPCSYDIDNNKSSYHQIPINLINHQIINGYHKPSIDINSIYSELYHHNNSKSELVHKEEQIELLSACSITKNTDLYIYTVNNNLYKSSVDTSRVSIMAKYRHRYQQNINVSNTTSTSSQSRVSIASHQHNNNNQMSIEKINTSSFVPPLQKDDKIIDIKCGLHHTLFLTKSGFVYSSGLNDVGQCGFNKTKFMNIPHSKPQLMATNIKKIACGSFHNLMINDNDELIVCGYNYCGQLGVTTLDSQSQKANNYQVNNDNNNNNGNLPNLNSSDSGDSFTSNGSNTSNASNTSIRSQSGLGLRSPSMARPNINISPPHISIRSHDNYAHDRYVEFEMVDTSDSDDHVIDDDEDEDDALLDGFAFQDDSDDDEDDEDGFESDDDLIPVVMQQPSNNNVNNNNVPIKNVLAIDIPTKNKYFMDLGLKIKHIDCGKFHSLVITKDGKCFTFGSNAFGNLGNGEESEWGATNPIPHQIRIQIHEQSNINNNCMDDPLLPPMMITESIIDGSCGENHNLLLTKSNKIIAFGDNSNHQCSMINKDKILSPFIISKEKELRSASNIC